MKKLFASGLLAGLLYFQFGCGDKIDLDFSDSRDTLSYHIVKLEKKDGDCKDDFTNCVEIGITYPEFDSASNDSVKNKLNKFIEEAILYYSYGETTPQNINQLMEQFVEHYQDFLLEMPDYAVAWKQTNEVKVILNSPLILSLEFFDYNFMGGAHPNTEIAYENFDTQTGDKIYLQDLFVNNYEEVLNKIGEKKFREARSIPSNKNFDSIGFWFDNNKFVLTDNFALSKNNLVFLYNSYEVAPYAMGRTKIEIPYGELKDIIKPEGLLWNFIASNE